MHQPDWSKAFSSLIHLGFSGISFLAFLSIGLGLLIHPIQFAIVQFFEGYWGPGRFAQRFRTQRILHYQRQCWELDRRGNYAENKLLDWGQGELGTILSPVQVAHRSERDETRRVRDDCFPSDYMQIMPTRLGNVLRSAEFRAGQQYGMDPLSAVPHLLLIAPTDHVDYVNDQRSQLDLAVRMTGMALLASGTAVLFLWPYHLWILIAIFPYALAYASYRGSVVAARHYGASLDLLVNLDRFALYQQLHLQLPSSTVTERNMNERLADLLKHDSGVVVRYKHPAATDEVK